METAEKFSLWLGITQGVRYRISIVNTSMTRHSRYGRRSNRSHKSSSWGLLSITSKNAGKIADNAITRAKSDLKKLKEGGTGADKLNKVYNSIKNSPKYPKNFTKVQNGTKKVKVNNGELLDELRKIEPGEWNKVYQNGYSDGAEVSIHYFQHAKTGKVFNVKVKPRWSTGW